MGPAAYKNASIPAEGSKNPLTRTSAGTGKVAGNRHPKIRDNVLIGASATILGNIVVNRGAQVSACPQGYHVHLVGCQTWPALADLQHCSHQLSLAMQLHAGNCAGYNWLACDVCSVRAC